MCDCFYTIAKKMFILALFSFGLNYNYSVADTCYPQLNMCDICDVAKAFANGQVNLYMRLRYEHDRVHSPPNFRDGMLPSLRTQLNYETAEFINSHVFLEMTNVALLITNRYNSGIPGIGNPSFAPISELKGTGVTKAYWNYTGFPNTTINYGRQQILLDNGRWVANSNFRQYPKSFDSLNISTGCVIPNTKIYYAFLYTMNTHLAANQDYGHHKLNTHLLHGCWNFYDGHDLIGYTYLDRDDTNTYNSNATYGMRAAGKQLINCDTKIHYALEYAYQSNYSNNPVEYNAYYYLIEAGIKHRIISPRIGLEVLSGDSTQPNKYLKTPMGSHHWFQGLYDFNIPPQGVRDFYAKIDAQVYYFCLGLEYHTFQYQALSNQTFANEIDIILSKQLDKYINVDITYAKLNGKNGFENGRKIWLTIAAYFG